MVRKTILLLFGKCLFLTFRSLSDTVFLFSGVWSETKLDQSPSEVKKPGETVKMPCIVSGFNTATDYVHWIRQKTGRDLEWIGRQLMSHTEIFRFFTRRFTLSYDTSSSTVYLGITSLTEDDSALYFCTQHCDAFDFWGGGTRLTVTSAPPVPPTVFPLIRCDSGDKTTFSCLALDFYPNSLMFEWSDTTGTRLDSVRYPSIQSSNKYTEVSLIEVSRSEDNLMSYQCSVTHPGGNKTVNAKIGIFPLKPVKHWLQIDGQTLVCTIDNFFPEDLSVKWKKNGNEVYGCNKWAPKQLGGLYSAVSVMKVKGADWDGEAVYTCEVTHQGTTHTKKASKALITVTLNPPSPKKIFADKQAKLECVVAGQDGTIVRGAEITWEINGERVTSYGREVTKFEDNRHSKTSIVIYNHTEWMRVSKVCLSDGAEPKVTVHTLPEEDIGPSAEVTLVCLVSSSVLRDYYIAWSENVGDNTSDYYDGINFPQQKTKNGYSATSVYTTTKDKWQGDYVFYCNVWPAGRENQMKPKGVSKAMGNSMCFFCANMLCCLCKNVMSSVFINVHN
uniref:Ig-like domain-containing protein n=1 Tax=Kryptolebias marmoratus TaxID=37003 RepID=A0A3Q3FNL2_KRYMA